MPVCQYAHSGRNVEVVGSTRNILTCPNQPLLHTVIFFIEMAIVTRLVTKFNTYYTERPGKQICGGA
jgi:hypothetical protein